MDEDAGCAAMLPHLGRMAWSGSRSRCATSASRSRPVGANPSARIAARLASTIRWSATLITTTTSLDVSNRRRERVRPRAASNNRAPSHAVLRSGAIPGPPRPASSCRSRAAHPRGPPDSRVLERQLAPAGEALRDLTECGHPGRACVVDHAAHVLTAAIRDRVDPGPTAQASTLSSETVRATVTLRITPSRSSRRVTSGSAMLMPVMTA